MTKSLVTIIGIVLLSTYVFADISDIDKKIKSALHKHQYNIELMQLLEQSCDAGTMRSCSRLGSIYGNSSLARKFGLERNYIKSLKYYTIACRHKYGKSCFSKEKVQEKFRMEKIWEELRREDEVRKMKNKTCSINEIKQVVFEAEDRYGRDSIPCDKFFSDDSQRANARRCMIREFGSISRAKPIINERYETAKSYINLTAYFILKFSTKNNAMYKQGNCQDMIDILNKNIESSNFKLFYKDNHIYLNKI